MPIDRSVESVATLITSIESFKTLEGEYVEYAEIVKEETDRSGIVRFGYQPCYFFKRRDFVVAYKGWLDGDKYYLAMIPTEDFNGEFTPPFDSVRGHYEALAVIEPTGDNSCVMRSIFNFDMKGDISKFLVDELAKICVKGTGDEIKAIQEAC